MSPLSSSTTSEVAKQFKDLGVTIHEILRYGYGGIFALALASLYEKDLVKSIAETISTPLMLVAAFGTGTALYTLSHHVFSPAVMTISEHAYGVFLFIGRSASGFEDRPDTMACSHFSDPDVMRVSEALVYKERLDDDEETEAAQS